MTDRDDNSDTESMLSVDGYLNSATDLTGPLSDHGTLSGGHTSLVNLPVSQSFDHFLSTLSFSASLDLPLSSSTGLIVNELAEWFHVEALKVHIWRVTQPIARVIVFSKLESQLRLAECAIRTDYGTYFGSMHDTTNRGNRFSLYGLCAFRNGQRVLSDAISVLLESANDRTALNSSARNLEKIIQLVRCVRIGVLRILYSHLHWRIQRQKTFSARMDEASFSMLIQPKYRMNDNEIPKLKQYCAMAIYLQSITIEPATLHRNCACCRYKSPEGEFYLDQAVTGSTLQKVAKVPSGAFGRNIYRCRFSRRFFAKSHLELESSTEDGPRFGCTSCTYFTVTSQAKLMSHFLDKHEDEIGKTFDVRFVTKADIDENQPRGPGLDQEPELGYPAKIPTGYVS